MGWNYSSDSKVLAWHAQGPGFNPQIHIYKSVKNLDKYHFNFNH